MFNIEKHRDKIAELTAKTEIALEISFGKIIDKFPCLYRKLHRLSVFLKPVIFWLFIIVVTAFYILFHLIIFKFLEYVFKLLEDVTTIIITQIFTISKIIPPFIISFILHFLMLFVYIDSIHYAIDPSPFGSIYINPPFLIKLISLTSVEILICLILITRFFLINKYTKNGLWFFDESNDYSGFRRIILFLFELIFISALSGMLNEYPWIIILLLLFIYESIAIFYFDDYLLCRKKIEKRITISLFGEIQINILASILTLLFAYLSSYLISINSNITFIILAILLFTVSNLIYSVTKGDRFDKYVFDNRKQGVLLSKGIREFFGDNTIQLSNETLDELESLREENDFNNAINVFFDKMLDDVRDAIQPRSLNVDQVSAFRHDTKNLIAAMDAETTLIKENLMQGSIEALDQYIDNIRNTLQYLVDKIEESKKINLRRTPEPERITLNNVVDTCLSRCHTKIEENNIDIIKEYEIGDTLFADREQAHVCFDNIFANSIRSIEKKLIDNLFQDENETDYEPFIKLFVKIIGKDNQQIEITIIDNGSGMNKEIKEKLYKEKVTDQVGDSHGSGGIMISHILKKNNFYIEVVKSTDEGTEQRIVGPAIEPSKN